MNLRAKLLSTAIATALLGLGANSAIAQSTPPAETGVQATTTDITVTQMPTSGPLVNATQADIEGLKPFVKSTCGSALTNVWNVQWADLVGAKTRVGIWCNSQLKSASAHPLGPAGQELPANAAASEDRPGSTPTQAIIFALPEDFKYGENR
jgi:hypothetical protein